MVTADAPDEGPTRDQAYQIALATLQQARQQAGNIPQHRALKRMALRPGLLLQVVALPLLLTAAVYAGKPWLFAFWRQCLGLWAGLLNLPLHITPPAERGDALGVQWMVANEWVNLPSDGMLFSVAALTLLGWVLSYSLQGKALPLQYLLRIVCGVQALALLFFWWVPAQFPYTVQRHLLDLANIGYLTLLATPVMLAMGYYMLRVPLAHKLLCTALILAYFAVFVPHQLVLHAFLLHHFSLLLMPLLYIVFGALFNMLVFVALYAWFASLAPADAMR